MSNKIISTKNMSREDWLAARKNGIGGSDAAAIIGQSPFKSAFEVYANKKSLIPDQEDNGRMRLGRDLEDYVARRFTEETKKKVKRRNAMIWHKNGISFGDIDREVVGEDALLECKTTSSLNKSKFKQGEYPPYYYVQCMHYLAVTGKARAYLAVLVLTGDFYTFTIERDEEEIRALLGAEEAFWRQYIVGEDIPDPDGSRGAGELLKAMYPESDGEEMYLYGMDEIAEDLITAKEIKKQAELKVKILEQKFQKELGACETGRLQRHVIKWINVSSRVLHSAALKEEQPEIYDKYSSENNYRKFTIQAISD